MTVVTGATDHPTTCEELSATNPFLIPRPPLPHRDRDTGWSSVCNTATPGTSVCYDEAQAEIYMAALASLMLRGSLAQAVSDVVACLW